ncbi:hypothetical protein [Amphritea balenae]|uniref:Uncharacterized protein n=1 Tax=Amphritea balenae TaxID=452629 RepID=A0A3P1SN76_9GAMM|nr:hypothetical protein [Amphritea balenae]RRC98616.1 hypothetical protein EHS89_13475 [Amphritea balenae]
MFLAGKLPSGTVSGVSLKIPYQDLGIQNATEYSAVVLLSDVDDFTAQYQVNLSAYNAWFGGGLYNDKIIEWHKGSGLYKVGAKASYPMFWNYFKVAPESSMDLQDSWVASCTEGIKGKVLCDQVIVMGDTQSKLSIKGDYVGDIETFITHYKRHLDSWKQSE